MNTKHYTSIEQSKKLLELGLNPETADMIYTMVNGRCTPFIRIETIDELEKDDVLCWSLGALLEVKPRMIEVLKENLPFHFFQSESEWIFQYGYPNEVDNSIIITGSTPIEGVYFMVVWLLENGYIKKRNQRLLVNNLK